LGSEAAEGAPFSTQIVLGTGVRLDLRRIMFEDRSFGVVLLPSPKKRDAKTARSWHANMAQISECVGRGDFREVTSAFGSWRVFRHTNY
jgi:hypothetical protein